MFYLLVSRSGWANARDTMPEGRALEYTEQHLIRKFKLEGQLDLPALSSLPTLFLEESSGRGDQVARVGTITRAKIAGRDAVLEYTYDPAIPPHQQ